MTSLRVMVARLGVLAVIMAGVGQAPAQQFMMGQGSSSCGSWTEARKTKDLHQDAQQQWVFGFLSGTNLGFLDPTTKTVTPYAPDFRKGRNFDSIVAWIDNYCTAHPFDEIATAAIALLAELRSRAQ